MNHTGVWVIDSSALISAKRAVAARDQSALFKRLEEMVENSELYFPKQVMTELNQERHVDVPEAWSLNAGPKVTRAFEPDDVYVQRVMAAAGDMVDIDAEGDPGDPYVLAQALALTEMGMEVCIVTEDHLDHQPLRIAMTTGCQRMGLHFCRLADFLAQLGFQMRPLEKP